MQGLSFVACTPVSHPFSCARIVTRRAFFRPRILPVETSSAARPLVFNPYMRMSASTPPSAAEGTGGPNRGCPAPPGPAGLSSLVFGDTFVEALPADTEHGNFTRQVRGASYSFVDPTNPAQDDQRVRWRMADPEGEAAGPNQLAKGMICWSTGAAELLDLDGAKWPEGEELESAIDVLGGFGHLWRGMKPYAQCYSGHQFGSFAGQLGDGRAITLGEYFNSKGERWELQLKGAGMTPYSRRADGRAVLRSSIREFLCSEAMFHLGVPTTRALSLVSTGAGVIRDMFYSGDPQFENGAICSRMAPSFLRIGSFENPASLGDHKRLKQTADYAIEHHFPALKSLPADPNSPERNRYGAFLSEVMRLNIEMVARWQGVGFVHGVLNSDNTSVLGLTIDYGPFGFLDSYDPQYTPNTTDLPGRRYSYENQPLAIGWNLRKFASAMVPLCGLAQAQQILSSYDDIYEEAYGAYFANKLGLSDFGKGDKVLVDDLLDLMKRAEADFTNCWRALSAINPASSRSDMEAIVEPLIVGKDGTNKSEWIAWMKRYCARVEADTALGEPERVALMNRTNPVYVLRNWMAQEAIDAANKGDYSVMRDLYQVLRDPFVEHSKFKRYSLEPPSWASRPGVYVNSCSS